jgi:hypothetical protein
MSTGWIGIDLDGTLAYDEGWVHANHIGKPIQKMVDFVKQLLAEGKKVKIFTARVHLHDPIKKNAMVLRIQDYLENECKLPRLEVTNIKDTSMRQLFDDRAYNVKINTGEIQKEYYE